MQISTDGRSFFTDDYRPFQVSLYPSRVSPDSAISIASTLADSGVLGADSRNIISVGRFSTAVTAVTPNLS